MGLSLHPPPMPRLLPSAHPLQAQSKSSPSRGWTWMEHIKKFPLQPHLQYTWMLDNVSLAFAMYRQLVFLFYSGALLQYHVYPALIVTIFFRLNNHKNRIKISAGIHHISLATFMTVANNKYYRGNSDACRIQIVVSCVRRIN